jgi:BON domain
MANEVLLCSGCGITLKSFMRMCPRCGMVRDNATPIETPQSTQSAEPEEPADATEKPISFLASPLRKPAPGDEPLALPRELVFLSPNEEQRRFPLITAAQKTLIALGIGLLILMLVIAWLLWRQQQRDEQSASAASVIVSPPAAGATPVASPSASPTPTPIPDPTIADAVKTALMAYNPLGYRRYQFEVKEGVVTVKGEAEHQPEKDGVENVMRLVSGVKSVVNNLKLKPEPTLPWESPNQPPIRVNSAEAKVLDEAMRRQMQLAEQATGREVAPPREAPAPPTPTPRLPAPRQPAPHQPTPQDAAGKKAAEELARREAEDAERRQEEQRRAEAVARARAEQARNEPSALRSGTVAWSGLVDGVEEIIIGGASASVRHISGPPAREVKASFSAPVPRAPVSVRLISSTGRSPITITQEPSAANGYTTIVRIDDGGKGGDKLYQFTLRWSVP